MATTLYYLTDWDIQIDNHSPWGQAARSFSSFCHRKLRLNNSMLSPLDNGYSGGGAMEVLAERLARIDNQAEKVLKEKETAASKMKTTNVTDSDPPSMMMMMMITNVKKKVQNEKAFRQKRTKKDTEKICFKRTVV